MSFAQVQMDHTYNQKYYQNGVFQIVNCKFVNNTSVGENGTGLDAYIIPHVNYNVALGRGGGLSIVL